MSSSLKFKTGDHVLIKNEFESKPVIGKIEEILPAKNINEITIRYNLFMYPEDTNEGRQEHNGKNEIYKTGEIEKEFYTNIISKCDVVSYEIYMKKVLLKQNVKDVYFYRQKYSKEDDAYLPDLDPICFCNKIFNPDREFSQCSKCKEYFHMKCYHNAQNKKCPNVNCTNNLSLQFASSIKREEKRLGHKRERQDNDKDKGEERYRNLPEANKNYLIQYIDKLEKMNSMLSKTLNEGQKARQNAHDKILYSLLYGIEELKVKSNDFWDKKAKQDKKLKLSKENLKDDNFISNYSNTLSYEIEYYIYLANKETISSAYKKKLLMLYTNLIDDRNTELRISILLGEISPSKLAEMSSEELAPSSVKKRRIEQQNKYFKEQVLMEEDAKIIAKNHKGDALLSVEPKDKNSEGFIPFEVLEQSKVVKETNKDNEPQTIEQMHQNALEEARREIKKKKMMAKKEEAKQHVKEIELKFKNLSSEQLKFYFELDEFKRENIIGKINEKIKSNLKTETVDEINKTREILIKAK